MLNFGTGSNESSGLNKGTRLIFCSFLVAKFWCLHEFVVNLGQNLRLNTQKLINAEGGFFLKKE